jgi:hypothetical protein
VFPNPSVGSPWVRFTAPEESDVVLDLYDVSGRHVLRAALAQHESGTAARGRVLRRGHRRPAIVSHAPGAHRALPLTFRVAAVIRNVHVPEDAEPLTPRATRRCSRRVGR